MLSVVSLKYERKVRARWVGKTEPREGVGMGAREEARKERPEGWGMCERT